jgi:glutamate-1-semialdehyde 2,1-aminomutase
MPLLLFADDPDFSKALTWAGRCAAHGVYLHPVHNWFLMTAHDAETIDAALERIDLAFGDLRDAVGAD